MAINEHILCESIRKIILESIRNEKIIFKREFLKQHSEYKSMSPRGRGEKEVRVGHSDPTFVVTADVAKQLISAIGYKVDGVIYPGGAGAKSNMYPTYIVQPLDDDGNATRRAISVVFGSSTAGQRFEFELHDQLKKDLESDLTSGFLKALGLIPDDIIKVEDREPPAQRPLTGEITNIGKAISDITLYTKNNDRTRKLPGKNDADGRTLYISLKDSTGNTYANQGYASAFKKAKDGSFTPSTHSSDAFIEALGIDKSKVAAGLSDYVSGNISVDDLCDVKSAKFDAGKIKKYLGSAMGYGYTYARQLHGGWYVMYLKSAKDTEDAIGEPVEVRIRYARNCGSGSHPRSKGTRATVKMDNGSKYDVAIRNSAGGVKPAEIKIKILKYPDNRISENIDRAFIRRLILEEVNEYAPAKESPRNIALRLLEEHGLEPAMNIAARDGNLAVLKILMDFGPRSASDVRHFPFGRM